MPAQSTKVANASSLRASFFVCLLVVIGLAGFSGALLELVRRWTTQEEYSHGFLIPIVVMWLLWTRRHALFESIGRPAWTGPILLLIALGMHITGELSAIFILSQLAFVVALLGLILGVGGFSLLRVTFIPIIFLIFAIPLPYFVDANLSLQLQLISSELGVFFIKLFQIPVYLDGNIIDLGTYKLQVVDACSGLRYLFPLLSLSFLAAYLFHAPIWQRAVVLFSSIPITIAMNGFRIGLVGVTVDRWGSQMAEGVLHFFEGWIIFVACAVLLAAEIYLLARISGRGFFEAFYVPTVAVRVSPEPESTDHMPFIACLLLICATGLMGLSISDRSENVPERNRFVTFPVTLGEWQGHASLLDPEVEHGLALDDYILSDYSKSDGKAVNLYVAYYASQRKGESPHSPLVCIPGDGWLITRFEQTSYGSPGPEQPLNRAIIERNGTKQIVYYWYDERGRKIASEYWSKWYLLSDAITKNRSDGALVRLITPVFPGEVERDADNRLQLFMPDLLPSLSGYLPSDTAPEIATLEYGAEGNKP
jgi:exosortase D (VPLPA-CTERM-specific)